MKIIAKYGNYELLKDEKGIYLHCYCGSWFSCGYEQNDTEAIKRFAGRMGCKLEDLNVF